MHTLFSSVSISSSNWKVFISSSITITALFKVELSDKTFSNFLSKIISDLFKSLSINEIRRLYSLPDGILSFCSAIEPYRCFFLSFEFSKHLTGEYKNPFCSWSKWETFISGLYFSIQPIRVCSLLFNFVSLIILFFSKN